MPDTTTFDRIKELAEKRGKSLPAVSADLKFSDNLFYRWKTSNPKASDLAKVADYFHVSVDYLLDDDISEITLSDKSTAQKSEHYLLTHFHRLSNSSKKELLNFLQYLEQRDESTRNKSAL